MLLTAHDDGGIIYIKEESVYPYFPLRESGRGIDRKERH
jgi:hypothetical protein